MSSRIGDRFGLAAIHVVVLGALAFAVAPAPAGAQALGPGIARGRAGLTPAEVERLFDGYVAMQAQEALKLTDDQYPQFLARLKTLQEARRRNTQARRALVAEMTRGLEARPGSEPQLRELVRRARDLAARNAEDLQRAYDGIDQVLDTVQQARFRVFEESVERRKFDLVLRARRRALERVPQ